VAAQKQAKSGPANEEPRKKVFELPSKQLEVMKQVRNSAFSQDAGSQTDDTLLNELLVSLLNKKSAEMQLLMSLT